MSERVKYRIRGMDCAEEVGALRRTVGVLPGVDQLDFDLLNGSMSLDLEPGGPGEDDILAAVRKAGLQAFPWDDSLHGPGASGVPEGFWERRGRSLTCLGSGIMLVLAFGTHAVLHGSILDAFVAGEGIADHVFPFASILLYLASIVLGVWFVIPKGIAAARNLRPDMNLLMVIAVIGAILIGEWFEAAAVAFLFSTALLLESWTVEKARRSIGALMDLAPTMARTWCSHDLRFEEKPVEDVAVGATAQVRPGERIPLDGVLTKGSTSVDQAPITGESTPVAKEIGDDVFAGTINNEGAFEFEVSKAAEDTTLARIIHLVEESRSRRAPSEQWVEKFARSYTPAMIALAISVAVVPPLLGGASWADWIYRGLVLLVIACPCALVISTPVSIVAGLTTAARHGVLIKGGVHLEGPAHLKAIALDKTGTLTYGRPRVQVVVSLNGHSDRELLSRAAALESHSEHPLAKAILKKAHAEGVTVTPAEDFRSVKGKGAEAMIDGKSFWIGSHRFMHEMGGETPEVHARAEEMDAGGLSLIAVGNGSHVCGLIGVADGVREQAASTVSAMRSAGIERIVMLTGDNIGTARAVAEATGIDEFRAELLPEDKVEAVESLVEEYQKVGMVGDGVNDAPAMATATLGIAMGAAGTDAAIETADIALMSDDLSKLPWLIRHSRRTLSIIKQNIWFALGLKLVFMGLALGGLATLWMAIAADMGASLLVIFNALRLLGEKDEGEVAGA